MFKIQLTQGKEALVSEEDHLYLILTHSWSWASSTGYAQTRHNGKVLLMQWLVAERMGLDVEKTIDHKDRNPLNNQRDNLRAGTHRDNSLNTGLSSNNTSGRKGVYQIGTTGRWRSMIKVHRKIIFLGNFDTFGEAVEARRVAKIKYGYTT